MKNSFQRKADERRTPGPDITFSGKQQVNERYKQREEGERPEKAIRSEEPELNISRSQGDEDSEQDPSGAGVGCGLRIGDHEEGKEEEGAALEPVKRDRERLPEPKGTREEEGGIG